MTQKRKLATYVHVDGKRWGPEDGEIPAHIAAKITNEKVWAKPGQDADGADGAETSATVDGEEKGGTRTGERLVSYVHVNGKRYGPTDDIPDDVAAQITNEKAWKDGKLPAVARKALAEMDQAFVERAHAERDRIAAEANRPTAGQADTGGGNPGPSDVAGSPPPPRSGAGSGKEAWKAYARDRGVQVEDNASREDIIAACEKAGVIEPDQR